VKASGEPRGTVRLENDGARIILDVNESIYCRDAILRACYWFSDRCHSFVTQSNPGILSITLTPKPEGPPIGSLVADFEDALLEQQLRWEIGQTTSQIRELIVAKAFAEADILEDAPVGDYRDPLDLADTTRVEKGKGP
jgi:His-Xaa-Ser system protein HxsD